MIWVSVRYPESFSSSEFFVGISGLSLTSVHSTSSAFWAESALIELSAQPLYAWSDGRASSSFETYSYAVWVFTPYIASSVYAFASKNFWSE